MINIIEYRVLLTETTKAFPKTCFYVCEITGILQTTQDEATAFVTDSYDGACEVVDFVTANYDYKAAVVRKFLIK